MILMSAVFESELDRVLLVVDDDALVQLMARRVFEDSFDRVCTATTVSEAEMILGDFPVTHILCDFDLGEGESENGFDLTARWRKQCPSISRVCIFSGHPLAGKSLPDHIDGMYFKGDPIAGLISLLLEPLSDKGVASTQTGEQE
jgi:CheY-like chemotaxis protein